MSKTTISFEFDDSEKAQQCFEKVNDKSRTASETKHILEIQIVSLLDTLENTKKSSVEYMAPINVAQMYIELVQVRMEDLIESLLCCSKHEAIVFVEDCIKSVLKNNEYNV